MSVRTRSTQPKNFSVEERERISKEVLHRCGSWINHRASLSPGTMELTSFAGFVIADWFSDANWRPYDSSQRQSVESWLTTIVIYRMLDHIRLLCGSRRQSQGPVEITVDWAAAYANRDSLAYAIQPSVEPDHINKAEINDEIARVLKTCTKAQKKVLDIMLQGYTKRAAGIKLGFTAYQGYETLEVIKARYGR